MAEIATTAPGEVAGQPKLVLRYPTDPARIAALLPPGLEPTGDPTVQVSVYCVPVQGEPEHGISTKIPARFDGVDGLYTLGIGIDQESAIFISQETNGQPKFPCAVRYFRLGDTIEASATHQGWTFLTFTGTLGEPEHPEGDDFTDDEWWIKVSRAVGGAPGAYDLPPRVVRVHMEGSVVVRQPVHGDLQLHPSPWDPIAELLPPSGPATAELITARHTARTITVAGPLDPEGFWPHVDTIGGSRWPGERGGPRRG